MSNERYTCGCEKLMQIDGEGGKRAIESMRGIAPDLEKYVVEFAFGKRCSF